MKADGDALSDPTDVDSLFSQPEAIHGLLKVAGSSPEVVNDLLEKIKKALQHDSQVILDVPGGDSGRIDGSTRAKPNRGKEQ